jgi:CelD/BcsL family acetyltransferase involved in cellulose biosynthesis
MSATVLTSEHRGQPGDDMTAEWAELADRTGASPFLRPEWFSLWCSAFRPPNPCFVLAHRDGRLVGVLPLIRRGRTLESMTNDHTPWFDLLADDGEARLALARAAMARPTDRITLDYLPLDGEAMDALRQVVAERHFRVAARQWERPPYVSLEGPWEAYEQGLDGKLRRDLARRRRRLEELGPVVLDVQDGRADLSRLLDEGFQLESSGWKEARGTAILSRPETRQFYTALAGWAAERGILRLSFLRVGGRAIAFQLGLEDRGAYFFVKGGYDPAYARFAPAKLLVQARLRRAFSDGLKRFEFLGPPEPFKLEWTPTAHELGRFQAFARTPAPTLRWAALVYARPAAARVRRALRRAQQLRSTRTASSKPPHS